MTQNWFFHDMRNRLTVARGFVHILRTGKAKEDPKLQEKYLGIVDESLESAVELIKEYEKTVSEQEELCDREQVPSRTDQEDQGDVPRL